MLHIKKDVFLLTAQCVSTMMIQLSTTPLEIPPHPNVGDSNSGPVLALTFPLVIKQQTNYECVQNIDQVSCLYKPLAFLFEGG